MTGIDPSAFAGLDLPAGVLARVVNRPIEDFILAVLRQGIPDLTSYATIPLDTPELFVVVRGVAEWGNFRGRRGFVDSADFAVHTFAQNPDGDEKGSLVADAVVDCMEQAFLEHWSFPNLGSVNKITCTQKPVRATDWATNVGPVQYADLPTGDWRYEARFNARINPPRG